jgi:hypothetical protein
MDRLRDSLSERIDEYGLERHDAVRVVEDILFGMIEEGGEHDSPITSPRTPIDWLR